MKEGWIKVYVSIDFYKAELTRQVLVEHLIEAVLLNKQGYPYNFGEVEIYVNQRDAEQATEIIAREEL
jgi:hypothetical protein